MIRRPIVRGMCTVLEQGVDKENLLNNPEPLQLVIIAFILVTLICDSGVIFKGEIKFWSLLRVKRLKICNLV